MNNEINLIENKELREQNIERVEVLNKVKELLLLPFGEFMTTKMVAEYYNVSEGVIKMCVKSNRDEIESDGYSVLKRSELDSLDSKISLLSKRGTFDIEYNGEIVMESCPNTGVALFTPRSVLRIGMLLRDSEVAKEVRTQLLNVHEVAKETNDEIVVHHVDEEQQLLINIGLAISNGDLFAYGQAVKEHEQYKMRHVIEDAGKYGTIYNSPHTYTTTDIAKDLGMSAVKLNKALNDKKVIFKKNNGTWYFYSKYEDKIPEYADYKVSEYGQQLRWTNKGREWIIELLKEFNQ